MEEAEIRANATRLADDIREFVEDEKPEVAVMALGGILAVLIFGNTSSIEEAAEKIAAVAENITAVTLRLHRDHAADEKAGA
ncbi:hypothetical protein FS799_00930 [Agrobacterium vitis]|uniref:hypothetical protein n=1 Tax=Agrobacterium vitis TaxID=373 RepID=UPI001F2180D8|nr:hypothetical protein [Agrobacterium vitis]MCE6073420.1 hypothetical protein [Agrobacterium vitis]